MILKPDTIRIIGKKWWAKNERSKRNALKRQAWTRAWAHVHEGRIKTTEIQSKLENSQRVFVCGTENQRKLRQPNISDQDEPNERKRVPNKSAYTKYMSNYTLQHLISLLRTFKTGCGCCCCWYTYVCREYVISQIVCHSNEMRQINNVFFLRFTICVLEYIRERLSMLICFQLLNKSTRFYSHAQWTIFRSTNVYTSNSVYSFRFFFALSLFIVNFSYLFSSFHIYLCHSLCSRKNILIVIHEDIIKQPNSVETKNDSISGICSHFYAFATKTEFINCLNSLNENAFSQHTCVWVFFLLFEHQASKMSIYFENVGKLSFHRSRKKNHIAHPQNKCDLCDE